MANDNIAREIARKQGRQLHRLELTADRIVLELARIGLADVRRVMRWGGEGAIAVASEELDDDIAAAVVEVGERRTKYGSTLRIKLADKVRALELLGRHLGVFVEKLEDAGKFVLMGVPEEASIEAWAAKKKAA